METLSMLMARLTWHCPALLAPRSHHVLPCRPAGVTVDIKKSTFKKLSKWLQAKAADGLVGKEEGW